MRLFTLVQHNSKCVCVSDLKGNFYSFLFVSGKANINHLHIPQCDWRGWARRRTREEGSKARVLILSSQFHFLLWGQLDTLIFRHCWRCNKPLPSKPSTANRGQTVSSPGFHQIYILVPFPFPPVGFFCFLVFGFVFGWCCFSSLDASLLPQPPSQGLILEAFTKTKTQGPQTRMLIPFGL